MRSPRRAARSGSSASRIGRVEVDPTVKPIGDHTFDGIPVNVPLALTEEQVPRAAGAILPPGAERIEIVDGTAYVGVSVKTNSEVKVRGEGEGWGKVNVLSGDVTVKDGSVIIAVPANAEQGFMVLESGEAERE